MSLINPASPEGFFHYVLVATRQRLRKVGKSLIALSPDPNRQSYFEEPLPPTFRRRGGHVKAVLSGQGILRQVVKRWHQQGLPELANMAGALSKLFHYVNHVEVEDADEDNRPISDFVYPLF